MKKKEKYLNHEEVLLALCGKAHAPFASITCMASFGVLALFVYISR